MVVLRVIGDHGPVTYGEIDDAAKTIEDKGYPQIADYLRDHADELICETCRVRGSLCADCREYAA